MRAMILAAGQGTRLHPLTQWRAKPALPVRGVPIITYSLALLAQHGVTEVMVNLHHLPETVHEALEAFRPPGMTLRISREEHLLGTGGGLRRARDFLRESDPCLVLAGDMVIDCDLTDLVRRHRRRGGGVSLLLRGNDPRAEAFGTIGVDALGRMRRIGSRFDLGGEVRAGVYVSVNVLSARVFDDMPERDVFGHLDDWLAPLAAAGADDIRGELLDASEFTWEPVGTLGEYVSANFADIRVSQLDVSELATRMGTRANSDLVLGAGAELEPGAQLRRSVVWPGERVPAGLVGQDGVFAAGAFHRPQDEREPSA